MPGRIHRALRATATALLACLGAAAGVAALLGLYAAVTVLRLPAVTGLGENGDPGPSAFMRAASCDALSRTYRPLGELDPRLGCAVVWAEDHRFFHHEGVDWHALESSFAQNWRLGQVRYGGSTIVMQLARNYFLDAGRTPSRKFREIVLSRRLYRTYPRLRLLEVYLNAAEWAPCVYGAEAAAQHYFGRDAGVLDVAEAVFLASMLPRPGRRPGRDRADRRKLVRRQGELIGHLSRAGLLSVGEARRARARVFALWQQGAQGRPPGGGPLSGWRPRPAAPMSFYRTGCGTVDHHPKPAQF